MRLNKTDMEQRHRKNFTERETIWEEALRLARYEQVRGKFAINHIISNVNSATNRHNNGKTTDLLVSFKQSLVLESNLVLSQVKIFKSLLSELLDIKSTEICKILDMDTNRLLYICFEQLLYLDNVENSGSKCNFSITSRHQSRKSQNAK